MRSSIYSLRAAVSMVAIVFCAPLVARGFWESPQKPNGEELIQRVLKAEHSRDLLEAVAQLVDKARRKQLREYKTHSHNTIALHAAWEEVKRSTSISRAELLESKEDESYDPRVNLNRRAVRQFIGFVEGRLKVNPPKWWLAKLRRAKTDWEVNSNVVFPRIDSWHFAGRRIHPYSKEKGVVHCLSDLFATPLADGGLEVGTEEVSCKFPARFLEAAKKKYGPTSGNVKPTSWLDWVGLTAWMDANRCVFGFHSYFGTGSFALHCIDRKSSKLIWSSQVWSYSSMGGKTGSGYVHWVEIRRSGDMLCLFGMDLSRVYIAGHSMKDGANLFHFTTSYFDCFRFVSCLCSMELSVYVVSNGKGERVRCG